jgi:anti-sigma factor RsiW
MDPAILERLMIDDALGALSPDVRALLEAFLAGDDAELAQWRLVADATKSALPRPTVESLPPFPRLRPWRIAPPIRMAMALAAALLIGIGTGLHFVPARSTPIAATPPIPAAPPAAVATVGVADFWSSKRLLAVALDTERHAQPPSHWNDLINKFQHAGGSR